MTIVGGILLIAIFPPQVADSAAVFYGTGGALIGVAVLVTVYEMIMLILALAKKINHPARLLVVSQLTVFTLVLNQIVYVNYIAFNYIWYIPRSETHLNRRLIL